MQFIHILLCFAIWILLNVCLRYRATYKHIYKSFYFSSILRSTIPQNPRWMVEDTCQRSIKLDSYVFKGGFHSILLKVTAVFRLFFFFFRGELNGLRTFALCVIHRCATEIISNPKADRFSLFDFHGFNPIHSPGHDSLTFETETVGHREWKWMSEYNRIPLIRSWRTNSYQHKYK